MTRRRAEFSDGCMYIYERLYEAGLFAPLRNKWIIRSTFLVGESSTMKNNDPIFISIEGWYIFKETRECLVDSSLTIVSHFSVCDMRISRQWSQSVSVVQLFCSVQLESCPISPPI